MVAPLGQRRMPTVVTSFTRCVIDHSSQPIITLLVERETHCIHVRIHLAIYRLESRV